MFRLCFGFKLVALGFFFRHRNSVIDKDPVERLLCKTAILTRRFVQFSKLRGYNRGRPEHNFIPVVVKTNFFLDVMSEGAEAPPESSRRLRKVK
ncbi:hypothetical protein R1flu_012319 [Riccia fluitans]|uniref:Secreted protein n=1 Tax=Riccia fluitans TaxID=41844 RepID=A0ABD1ZEE7_9MARC